MGCFSLWNAFRPAAWPVSLLVHSYDVITSTRPESLFTAAFYKTWGNACKHYGQTYVCMALVYHIARERTSVLFVIFTFATHAGARPGFPFYNQETKRPGTNDHECFQDQVSCNKPLIF